MSLEYTCGLVIQHSPFINIIIMIAFTKQNDTRHCFHTSEMRCLAEASAIATPSWVLVPLPSSSIITRLLGVASARMVEASISSTMKVL